MEILNLICYGSAILILGNVLIITMAAFLTSLYTCFSKKVDAKLFVKISVTIFLGCICPLIFRLILYFVLKVIGA